MQIEHPHLGSQVGVMNERYCAGALASAARYAFTALT